MKTWQHPDIRIEKYDNYKFDAVEYTIHIPELVLVDDFKNIGMTTNGIPKIELIYKTVPAAKHKIAIGFDTLMEMSAYAVGDFIFKSLPETYQVMPVMEAIRKAFPKSPALMHAENVFISKYATPDSFGLTQEEVQEALKKLAKVKGAPIGSPSVLARQLPGVYHRVKCPVTGEVNILQNVIIFLNDEAEWTREQIADWLEEISDPTGVNGPDIRFGVKNEQD